jgi:lipopolysaccharide/colanic/teichoic acid biosynthesis glycosyltransferase
MRWDRTPRSVGLEPEPAFPAGLPRRAAFRAESLSNSRSDDSADLSPGSGTAILALPFPFPLVGSWRLAVKRGIDIVLSLVLLLVTAPVIVAAAILVRMSGPGPILFVQRRNGRLGKEFGMFKFRTMTQDAERLQDRLAGQNGDRCFLKIQNDPRVTPVGRILRKYSIDELPQLVNVLKGDMSLTGPRPLLPCDVRSFPRDERFRRFNVHPGITGLWQVSGRSDLSDDERMALDLEYVDEWSLYLDLEILARTPAAVLTARGAC